MPPRWGDHKSRVTLETIMDDLPDRFRHVEIRADDGEMAGLKEYMRNLTEHLLREYGWCPVDAVMANLGIPPSEWYRKMMTV